MTRLEEVREMFGLNDMAADDGFYFCDWLVFLSKCELEKVADLIYRDGFDVSGFRIREIPHPEVFHFENREKDQDFLVIKEKGVWIFGYHRVEDRHLVVVVCESIAEAVSKFEWLG